MNPSIIQKHGYVWLSLPRESVLPLMLIERIKNNFSFLKLDILTSNVSGGVLNADIFSFFPKKGKRNFPERTHPSETVIFKGQDIIDIKSESFFSGSNLPLLREASAKLKLKNVSKLLYSFEGVEHVGVNNEICLEEHINEVPVVKSAPGYLEKLKKGDIYVVTDILQATSFSVTNASDFQFSNQVNASDINDYLSLKHSVNATKEVLYSQTYQRDKPVIFALKALRLTYNTKKQFVLRNEPLKRVKGTNVPVNGLPQDLYHFDN